MNSDLPRQKTAVYQQHRTDRHKRNYAVSISQTTEILDNVVSLIDKTQQNILEDCLPKDIDIKLKKIVDIPRI